MKNWKRWLIMIFLAMFSLASCTASESTVDKNKNTTPVLLAESASFRVISDNPAMIAPGEDAVFQIEMVPGFSVRESTEYTYADGYITVKNVRVPTTITVGTDFGIEAWLNADPAKIPTGQEFNLSCRTDRENYGIVTATLANGVQASASRITATAEPTADGRFVCWSLGASLEDGGIPFIADEAFTFYLSMDTTLYANFAAKESATLIYDTNGGQAADGGQYIRQDAPTDFYYYPHALANQGQMTRENHVLYAYNTKPDGSGIQYTFGANVVTPESGTLMLYAQWLYADPSQFTYSVEPDGVHITGCTSTDEWVVIPEEIEGTPVTTIKTKAFNKLSTMTTLVFNRRIEWVSDAAVYNCPNFTTLYLCDNIKRIPDTFYEKCPEFQTLHLGAVLDPTLMNQRAGTFHVKFQRLLKAQAEGKDAFIIISGSSSEYGFDSKVFEQEMNYEYYPVNLGITVQISVLYLLEAFKDFVDEGDIVVQAPEASGTQLGGNAFVSYYWRCYEGVPELVSHVDIRNYTKLFSTLTEFNDTRFKMDPTSYSDHAPEIDRYGDNQTKRLNPSPSYGSGQDNFLSPTMLSTTNAARLNKAYADIEATGAKVYFSFAPINVNSFSARMKTTGAQNAYQRQFDTLLNIPVISKFSTFVLEGKYFYNSNYHPTNEGAALRTKLLVADLKAQLEKEAQTN